ncbi:MAG: mechanosensitive ion channel family protein [Flavobacteriaceae bacterium]|tara:strand:- start:3823 stop:5070 length:1248 start_codon:yes stop_codon:yes gene_type:complete
MNDFNIQSLIKGILIDKGANEFWSQILSFGISFILIFLSSLLIYFISKKIIVKIFNKVSKKTESKFDDFLILNKLPVILSYIIPVYYLFVFFPDFFTLEIDIKNLFLNILEASTVIIFIWLVRAILKTVSDYLKTLPNFKDKPIDSYIQVFMIFLWFLGVLIILSIFTEKDISTFIATLGGLTAVILFVFKDSILGFVASVQITVNDTVRIGDWITMKNSNADGDVISISLSSVQVQNFDKTITSIPTYKLVSDSFINWRGMSDSDGRRIKRSLLIRAKSIKFLDSNEIKRIKKIELISDFINNRENKIKKHNDIKKINKSILINGRNMTNLGLFRIYTESYLKNHEMLNKKMTIMCRQLAPTSQGIPIEIYAFSKEKEWVKYEQIMSDIFDHLLASINFFDLEIFEFSQNFEKK